MNKVYRNNLNIFLLKNKKIKIHIRKKIKAKKKLRINYKI